MQDARKYSVLCYSLSIAQTACFLVFLCVLIFTRAAVTFAGLLGAVLPWQSVYLSGPLVMAGIGLVFTTVFFPLLFYRSFLLEHQFGLSRQTLGAWARDQLRAGALSFILAAACLDLFFFLANNAPAAWWLWLSFFWVSSQFILAFLAPQFIIPLFFVYKPFSRPQLQERILSLARSMGLKLFTISEINLSAKTTKANAGLVGWGGTRRVVIGDTLSRNYSDDEIMVILAHEFAHEKLLHLPGLIVFQSGLVVCALGAVVLSGGQAAAFARPESLPLIMAAVTVFALLSTPLHNALSRHYERQADAAALQATGDRNAFISAMEKLSDQNLSDRDPGWLVKVFFFDHPPVSERIASARRDDDKRTS